MDGNNGGLPPVGPLPGSAEKVALMALRYERGEPLFRPQDLTFHPSGEKLLSSARGETRSSWPAKFLCSFDD